MGITTMPVIAVEPTPLITYLAVISYCAFAYLTPVVVFLAWWRKRHKH